MGNIADSDQVLRKVGSGLTLCSEMSQFCKIDKIMFTDSENQGRKRYFMKLYYLGKCKEYGPRSDLVLYIVGNISLKKFDIFQFRL